MATTGVAPVKQALVKALRDNLALKTMVGADGISEGVSPRASDYPYIVYAIVYSYREYDSTAMTLVTDVDVWSISADQIEAHTLDQLVNDSLEDKILTLGPTTGQTSLFCRRLGDLSSADIDTTGDRVYRMGGVYRIWTDQARTA